MHYPSVTFRYSRIFDSRWRSLPKLRVVTDGRSPGGYPTAEAVQTFIGRVTPLWKAEERLIFREISAATGLRWPTGEIACYVVGRVKAFSDPLTVPVRRDPMTFVDTLTHELIHRLFMSVANQQHLGQAWKYMGRRYPSETSLTRRHILLYAVHNHVFISLYGKQRLSREIRQVQQEGALEYIRAWEVVRDDGYLAILDALRSTIGAPQPLATPKAVQAA